MSKMFTDEVMTQVAYWANYFSADWKNEAPIRIHSGEISDDGSPQWHPDFARWLVRAEGRNPQNPEQRLRTTKAMRRLRRFAIREYEVAYRILVLGERVEDTTRWLNERAYRNGVPYPPHRPTGPHYVRKDTLALLIAGVDYARQSW